MCSPTSAIVRLAQKRRATLIVKPDAGCQGRGIFLAKSLDAVEGTEGMIAQQYLNSPMLVDGYKFDLRLYVLVLSCSPLRVLLFKEGCAQQPPPTPSAAPTAPAAPAAPASPAAPAAPAAPAQRPPAQHSLAQHSPTHNTRPHTPLTRHHPPTRPK